MTAPLQPRLQTSPRRAWVLACQAPLRSVKGLESDGLSSPITNSCDRRRLDVVPVFARGMRWLLATLACVGLGWGGRRPLLEGTAFLAASLSSQLNQLERPNKFQDSFPPSLVHRVLVPPTSIALHDIGLAPGIWVGSFGSRPSVLLSADDEIANGPDCVELTINSKRCAEWAELDQQDAMLPQERNHPIRYSPVPRITSA